MTVLDDAAAPPTAPAGGRRRFDAVTALVALVAVAAAAALIFGVRFALAVSDEGLDLAAQRDVVLVDAQQAAININSLDFDTVHAGLDLWEQSSTGPLLEEFRSNRAEYEKIVVEARRVTEATVKDAAVAELDVRAGTARVLVGLDVEVRPEGQEPVVTRLRLQLEMSRTAQGWKASRAAPVRTPAS